MNTNPPFHPLQRTPHRPRRLPEHLLRLQAEYGTTQQAIFRLADLWMKVYDLEQALQNREIHPRDISEARRDLAGLKFDYEAFEEDARGLRDRRLLWVHGRGRENEDNRVEQRPVVEGPRLGGLRPFPRGRLPVMHGALEGGREGVWDTAREGGPSDGDDDDLSAVISAMSLVSPLGSENDEHAWSRGGSRAPSPSTTRQPGGRGVRSPVRGQIDNRRGEQGTRPRSGGPMTDGGRQDTHAYAETVSNFSEGTRS